MRRRLLAALGATALVGTGCTKAQIVDLTMVSARHVPRPHRAVGGYQLLGGDMHCHVLPPDAPYHVAREVPATVRLAEDEGLDFVVLTPHVPSRFFLDPDQRDWVRTTQATLRAQLRAEHTDVLLVPGMEYTDGRYGHLGLSFADIDAVLDATSVAALEARPELFFETWHARGGLMTVNHPFLGPLPRVPIAELHYDLSWRGFAPADRGDAPAVPSEIRWLSLHADAVETWNESVGHVRDRWFLGDAAWELRQGTHLVERLARTQERRVAPVGGSDSHGSWLRPTTWVLAEERTLQGVHDAIAAGRTCVRGPDACTLQVRDADGVLHVVGSSVRSTFTALYSAAIPNIVGASADGEARYFVNGALVAEGTGEQRVPVPGTCATLHVQVNDSVSAPIYVDCPWAEARATRE